MEGFGTDAVIYLKVSVLVQGLACRRCWQVSLLLGFFSSPPLLS